MALYPSVKEVNLHLDSILNEI